VEGELHTGDANRRQPYRLWLELKIRGNMLNGSLVPFSRREFPTGSLSHWVALRRREN
jgi:hypothetical protein